MLGSVSFFLVYLEPMRERQEKSSLQRKKKRKNDLHDGKKNKKKIKD